MSIVLQMSAVGIILIFWSMHALFTPTHPLAGGVPGTPPREPSVRGGNASMGDSNPPTEGGAGGEEGGAYMRTLLARVGVKPEQLPRSQSMMKSIGDF